MATLRILIAIAAVGAAAAGGEALARGLGAARAAAGAGVAVLAALGAGGAVWASAVLLRLALAAGGRAPWRERRAQLVVAVPALWLLVGLCHRLAAHLAANYHDPKLMALAFAAGGAGIGSALVVAGVPAADRAGPLGDRIAAAAARLRRGGAAGHAITAAVAATLIATAAFSLYRATARDIAALGRTAVAGRAVTAVRAATDLDGDGAGALPPRDCAPLRASIHPGAKDTPGDGVDQDCSGSDAPRARPRPAGARKPRPARPPRPAGAGRRGKATR